MQPFRTKPCDAPSIYLCRNSSKHLSFRYFQWRIPWLAYVIYRVVVAILFIAWILADFLDEASKFYSDHYAIWLVFATNWSFLLLGVCAAMHAAIVLTAYIRAKHCTDSDPSDDGSGRRRSVNSLASVHFIRRRVTVWFRRLCICFSVSVCKYVKAFVSHINTRQVV